MPGSAGALRTLPCMQGIVSGGLLVAAFAAVTLLALLVALRLYRISRPGRSAGQSPARAGGPRDG